MYICQIETPKINNMKIKHLLAGMLAFATLACGPEKIEPDPEKPGTENENGTGNENENGNENEKEPVTPALEVSVKEFTVEAEGGKVTLTFTTNQDWTLTPSEDWVTVEPASGAASEAEISVEVTVAASTVEAERTATVLVKAGELEETVTIAQAAYVVVQDGTEANPYLIKTLEDLVAVREKASLETPTYFRLENDIDMASVENWVPVNCDAEFKREIHFDGNFKTISNFAPKTWNMAGVDGETVAAPYASLFGVIYGSCKNLTVVNASLAEVGASSGILAGYVGTQTAEGEKMPGLVSNVTVKGTITTTGDKVGGLTGNAYNATIENCNVEVVISTSSTDCAGLIGKSVGDLVVTNCNVKANITSTAAAKNRVGGLIGWNSTATTTITNCHVLEGSTLVDASSKTSATNGNFGGFIGFGDTKDTILTISKSSATVIISGNDFGTYNAGFIGGLGYASTAVITDCWAKGSVVGNNYTGGFCGAVQNSSTIERCWADVEVVSSGQRAGSFVGTNTTAIVIKNCYSLGNATGTGQQIAGLIGYDKVGATIECCYAAGDITSNKSGSAGLVGTMDGTTSSVVKCLAWNKNIVCNRTAASAWAPGAFVGAVTKNGGKYADCYRRADMVLTDAAGAMTLFDQENVENDYPAAPEYSAETTQRAYHGKAAAADATASSVAKTLGWDEAIWDLSGDLPKLK